MKKYFCLSILVVFALTSMANAQLFEKDNKNSVLDRRISEIERNIKVLKEEINQYGGMGVSGVNNKSSFDHIIKALEMSINLMQEELEHLKHEQEWRKTLPKKFAYKLDDIETKIHQAWEKDNEKEAQRLERELEELREMLHREFDKKNKASERFEVTEDLIWKHMPEELREKIEKHHEAAEKLDEAGYKDMAQDLREKARVMYEDAKKDIVNKLHKEWEKERKEAMIGEWWHKLPEREQMHVQELKQELLKAAVTGNKDYLNKIADKLRELYKKATSTEPDGEIELKIKKLTDKKHELMRKLDEMQVALEKAKAKEKPEEVAEISKFIHVLKQQIAEIDAILKEMNQELPKNEHKKDEPTKDKTKFDTDLARFRAEKKKIQDEIEEIKTRLNHQSKVGNKNAIAEHEKILASYIKKLQEIEKAINDYEHNRKKEAIDREMKEQKLKKLMQLKAEKEEMIRILEKIERESSEPNVEASGSKIQKIINQKRMELEAIEAAIKELSK